MKTVCIMLTLCAVILLQVHCADTKTETATTETAKPENCVGQIPFSLERSKVIITATIGDSKPLKIILDSGMGFDGFYMFHKELQDDLAAESIREVIVPGAGDSEPSNRLLKNAANVIARLSQATVAISKWLPHNNRRLPRFARNDTIITFSTPC